MSAMMTRRLQLLLDEDRYQRVAARAEAERLSVAAVIRDAIDASLRIEDASSAKRAAWQRLQGLWDERFDWPEDFDVMEEIRQSREERGRADD